MTNLHHYSHYIGHHKIHTLLGNINTLKLNLYICYILLNFNNKYTLNVFSNIITVKRKNNNKKPLRKTGVYNTTIKSHFYIFKY